LFWFGNPFMGNMQSTPSYKDKREEGKLYYRDKPLAPEKTPRQLMADFPELSSYLPMLVWYGMADVTVENLIQRNGLANVQRLIDNMTR